MKENEERLITNDIQCLRRRRGGPCYASFAGRAHPECRAAAEESQRTASESRLEERMKRRAARLADSPGNKLGIGHDTPATPHQAHLIHLAGEVNKNLGVEE